TLAQQGSDLFDSLWQVSVAGSRGQDIADAASPSPDLLLHGGVGNEDNVILVLSPGRLPLRFEHTHDTKRDVAHLNDLSYTIDPAKGRGPPGPPQHRHCAGSVDLLRRKPLAGSHGPFTNGEVLDARPLHHRGPILVGIHYLVATAHQGCGIG